MILKKFFGKTIEVAKKSARQMYGDEIVFLESFESDGTNDAGVTVMVGAPHQKKEKKAEPKESSETPFRNVFYKRGDIIPKADDASTRPAGAMEETSSFQGKKRPASEGKQSFNPTPDSEKISNNLRAVRAYALKELESRNEATTDNGENNHPESENVKPVTSSKTRFQPGASHTGFKRFAIQTENTEDAPAEIPLKHSASETPPPPENDSTHSFTPFTPEPESTYIEKAPATAPSAPMEQTSATHSKTQREITALHKRFDRLEALLDSALISSNLDYASHPAFQQLVETGIKPAVIAQWFRQIIESGTDPDVETEQFMAQLSGIIRNAIKKEGNPTEEKYMLFAGPSGSGKTQLIMKLALHPEFLAGKRIAIVSILPDNGQTPYYTILRPFCEDHNVPYFEVHNAADVRAMQQKWESFDHVLFDTPSIPIEQNHSFRQYWKIRQTLASVTPMEVHYVINASLNRYYFRNSGTSHHPLQPDFVAITHLDEVSQWGPIIPFMEQMGCGARYVSTGSGIPDGLEEFNAAWFAKKVLHDS
ncbi:hypothetical protein QLX67_11100 [Balneolaceae bacterium ANBcel3]|nr:hypothetical protein [Balneolaceae bacterium ANBcel3]